MGTRRYETTMRAIVTILLTGCVLLAGCDNAGTDNLQKGEIQIEETEGYYDSDAMDISRYTDKVYSEADDYEDMLPYFDFLPYDEYIILNRDDGSFLLFHYGEYSCVKTINEVTGVGKNYTDDGILQISVTADVTTHKGGLGCIDPWTGCPCILKLDEEINSVEVRRRVLSKFAGGKFRSSGKWGIIDGDFNVILPPKYDYLDSYSDGYDIAGYKASNDEETIMMDVDYNPILTLGSEYFNVCYAGPGRILAAYDGKNGIETVLLDTEGNIIKGPVEGRTYENRYGIFYYEQRIFTLSQKDKGGFAEGVWDLDFNVIIEPIYWNISLCDSDSENMYYCVQNKEGKFGCIDHNGVIRVPFEHDMSYDACSAYKRMLGICLLLTA